MPGVFPTPATEAENRVLWTKVGMAWSFFALASNHIPDVLPQSGSQCFPFYIYDEDGTNRRENITNWALERFREHYGDAKISKWDIFHYVYGVLHHAEYREKYAENLKRELPRIPLAGGTDANSTSNSRSSAALRMTALPSPTAVRNYLFRLLDSRGVAPGYSWVAPAGQAVNAG